MQSSDLPIGTLLSENVLKRFLNKLVVGENGCVEFGGDVDKDGYGRISVFVDGKRVRVQAHRWALQFMKQEVLPSDILSCHKCDNPGCVNPAHLFDGTHKENMVDMINKGRAGFQK